jgi:hypothetical protein
MRAGANSTRNSRRIRAEPYSEHGRRKPRLSRCIECEKLPVKKGRLTRIRGERILHHRPMVPQSIRLRLQKGAVKWGISGWSTLWKTGERLITGFRENRVTTIVIIRRYAQHQAGSLLRAIARQP